MINRLSGGGGHHGSPVRAMYQYHLPAVLLSFIYDYVIKKEYNRADSFTAVLFLLIFGVNNLRINTKNVCQ